jgi:transposase
MERKVKYHYAFKLECVALVLKKHYSNQYVSNLKGPNESNIRKWVGFFKTYGKVGLSARKNQSYPIGFKIKVLKTIDKESLSLRATCLEFNIPDAAIIENFFGILKSEMFYTQKFTSIEQLKQEIKKYIIYYNNERIKSNLNKMRPIKYRAHYYQNYL